MLIHLDASSLAMDNRFRGLAPEAIFKFTRLGSTQDRLQVCNDPFDRREIKPDGSVNHLVPVGTRSWMTSIVSCLTPLPHVRAVSVRKSVIYRELEIDIDVLACPLPSPWRQQSALVGHVPIDRVENSDAIV